jgi:hypothetical protein
LVRVVLGQRLLDRHLAHQQRGRSDGHGLAELQRHVQAAVRLHQQVAMVEDQTQDSLAPVKRRVHHQRPPLVVERVYQLDANGRASLSPQRQLQPDRGHASLLLDRRAEDVEDARGGKLKLSRALTDSQAAAVEERVLVMHQAAVRAQVLPVGEA